MNKLFVRIAVVACLLAVTSGVTYAAVRVRMVVSYPLDTIKVGARSYSVHAIDGRTKNASTTCFAIVSDLGGAAAIDCVNDVLIDQSVFLK